KAVRPTEPAIAHDLSTANDLLSFAQEGLWFLWQLEPDATAYNRPTFLRLSGPLDCNAFERALNEVTKRHEILRAVFPDDDGKPRQVIQPWHFQPLPCENLSHLPVHSREKQLKELALAAAQQPFDLARGPVVRARLIQLRTEDHVL